MMIVPEKPEDQEKADALNAILKFIVDESAILDLALQKIIHGDFEGDEDVC